MDSGHKEMLEWLDKYGVENKDDYTKKSLVNNKSLKIDLHRMTYKEARTKLSSVFHTCIKNKIKKLTVIHGKGLHSVEDPVLKDLVYEMIEYQYIRHIKHYGPAKKNNGGDGATVIKFN